MWCDEVKWRKVIRYKEKVKKLIPPKTCKPCKPVNIKKLLAKILSDIVNKVSLYSTNCNIIKEKPNNNVKKKPSKAETKERRATPLCAHVTAKPELINNAVFKLGISLYDGKSNA